MTIRILLADDHIILRQGLHPLLDAERGLRVVGEAGSGLETLKKIDELRPDVVVLDLNMPDLNGLEVIRQIQASRFEVRIVILTMMGNTAYVMEALKHGGCSYVMKGEGLAALVEAIRKTMRGERYLSPSITQEDIESYIQKTESQEIDPYETLTNREREIVNLVVEGLSNNEIADRLMISRRTVEKHREHALAKLHLGSQNELIRFAIAHGLIPMEERGG